MESLLSKKPFLAHRHNSILYSLNQDIGQDHRNSYMSKDIFEMLAFDGKIVIVDAMPIFVIQTDVIVNVGAVFKELVAGRTVIISSGGEMLVPHVPPDLGGHALPANHAHKRAIAARPKVVPH